MSALAEQTLGPPVARRSELPSRNLGLELVRVTEAAAMAAGRWMGRGDKEAGDAAAVAAMRLVLGTIDMTGTIVIGEGEKDAAPMLYAGERVGNGAGAPVDVAVDPVEGTALLASGRPDAISVVGVAPRGTMWTPGPAYYMQKLVTGRDAAGAVTPDLLDGPVAAVLARIGEAKGKPPSDLTVFVLDKPRHAALIAELRRAGARVLLRTDGDVAGALMAATPGSGVDLLLGVGGTPEGVITACAVIALGGAMLGRLAPQRPPERDAVRDAGLDLDLVLAATDLVRSEDVYFAATGITDGVLLPGVRYAAAGPITHSMVLRGRTGTMRAIRAEHRWDKLHALSSVPY